MSLGQCNHAVLCQQIGQEGLFREIRSLHGLLQKQRRRHVSVLRRFIMSQLCVSYTYCEKNISHDSQRPTSPPYCETGEIFRCSVGNLWAGNDSLCVYRGTGKGLLFWCYPEFPSKPLYLTGRRILRRAVIV